jgi:HSP20 family molecular chaperone IbpA
MTTRALASRLQSLVSELAQRILDSPVFAPIRRLMARKCMPLEDEMTDDGYVVRAELPGIDPASDVDVTTHDGWLTITADRRQEVDFTGSSEFVYGSFARSVPLPVDADPDSIATSYDNGILTVSVPVSGTEAAVDDDAVLALD